MNLSTDLLLQFARTTKDSTNKKNETTVYGTIVEYSGSNYVKIDGSDQLTPADSTVSIKPGDRVTVLLKNHTATITGNISSPAASDESVEVVVGDIAEFNKVLSNYAKVTDLNAEKARIDDLITDYAVINENLTANTADILSLKTDKLSAKDIEGKYANIDFSNITNATMEWFYSHSGLIQNVTVGNETITGELVGVTLKGDLIEGNTVKAEKLIVKGSDGLYYKLNTDGVTVEAEQTDYNSLNGSIITAKSITASKISVDDLVAFDATIGGFNITDSSIYSGVKESIDNTTSGVYLDKYGQIALGDSQNFIKYYKDQNGNYKLEISAESINTNTSFVVKNGSSFQGTNTSGELRNNLQPCNTNDNCVIGYGSYNAGEGATNIYGKTISLTYDNLKLNGIDYDSGWKTPSISSSLSIYGSDSYNAIKYRKVGKVVDICGAVSPASTSTLANGEAVTVFTLPQAYRPSYTRTYVCHGSDRDVFMVQVQSGGDVTISRYRSATSTSNAYPTSVATTNWLPISVTFTVD